MTTKQILLLIGPKGSGKSFIGTLLEQHFDIPFVRVEDRAKAIKQDRSVDNESYLAEVFQAIEQDIRERLQRTDRIVFESTGLTDYFDHMLANLKRDFNVTTIGVSADSQTCLERVRTRDQTIHINISDDQVSMINQQVKERNLQTDFRIDNENKSAQEIVEELRVSILANLRR